MDEALAELQRLWDEHCAVPGPAWEWSEVEQRFGYADTHPEALAVDGADELLHTWGGPDLMAL